MSTYDKELCDRLCREAREQYALTEQQGYGVQAGTMHGLADQLEAAGAEIGLLRGTFKVPVADIVANIDGPGLDAAYIRVLEAERDKLQAEIDAARSILGASPSETLQQAAERVELACAERARERDNARWADETRKKAASVVIAERDLMRPVVEAAGDTCQWPGCVNAAARGHRCIYCDLHCLGSFHDRPDVFPTRRIRKRSVR